MLAKRDGGEFWPITRHHIVEAVLSIGVGGVSNSHPFSASDGRPKTAHTYGQKEHMNELALFAGAGGGILGSHLLGWRTVCAVEWEPYPASVLVQRQNDGILPPFPIWDDVQTFDGRPWRGLVDVVSGGFPCQAFSSAAHGNNTARDYWPEMLRIVGETRARFVWAENVSEDAICIAQADLACAGYKTLRVRLDAGQLGADHVRERWWLVAHSDRNSELGRAFNAEMEMLRKKRSGFWKTYTIKPGMDDGVAARMDRLKAIGNGQVPAVVRAAFQLLRGQK